MILFNGQICPTLTRCLPRLIGEAGDCTTDEHALPPEPQQPMLHCGETSLRTQHTDGQQGSGLCSKLLFSKEQQMVDL